MQPNIEIFSNACLTSWGATYNGHSCGGNRRVEESKIQIKVLGMKGALFGLKIYCKDI